MKQAFVANFGNEGGHGELQFAIDLTINQKFYLFWNGKFIFPFFFTISKF